MLTPREVWARRALRAIRPRFRKAGFPIPLELTVRVRPLHPDLHGYHVVGEINLSSTIRSGETFVRILMHEAVHASTGPDHGNAFGEAASAVGLRRNRRGGWGMGVYANKETAKWIRATARRLGPYPPARVKDL